MYLAGGAFIANAFDPEGKCHEKLAKYLKSVDIYFHPSNSGDWCDVLGILLTNFSTVILKRLKMETTTNFVPEDYKLPQKNIDDTISTIIDVAKLALFTKSNILFKAVVFCVNRFALIRPELVIPPLMEYIISGLETVTETHQTEHAIEILIGIGRVLASKYYK